MSVRVVRDITCPTCAGDRAVVGGWALAPILSQCHACHGTGTVTEPVTCAGCRYASPFWADAGEHYCGLMRMAVLRTHGCTNWEPREGGG